MVGVNAFAESVRRLSFMTQRRDRFTAKRATVPLPRERCFLHRAGKFAGTSHANRAVITLNP